LSLYDQIEFCLFHELLFVQLPKLQPFAFSVQPLFELLIPLDLVVVAELAVLVLKVV